MKLQTLTNRLTGAWEGKKETYLQPNQLSNLGEIKLFGRFRLDKKILELEYTHMMETVEHSAILIIVLDDEVEAAWIDSYHTVGKIMNFTGATVDDKIILFGEYGSNETWKWRIEIFSDNDQLCFDHYNIPPKDAEYLGVRALLQEIEDDELDS